MKPPATPFLQKHGQGRSKQHKASAEWLLIGTGTRANRTSQHAQIQCLALRRCPGTTRSITQGCRSCVRNETRRIEEGRGGGGNPAFCMCQNPIKVQANTRTLCYRVECEEYVTDLCGRRSRACSSERSSPPLLSLQPRRDPQHHLQHGMQLGSESMSSPT